MSGQIQSISYLVTFKTVPYSVWIFVLVDVSNLPDDILIPLSFNVFTLMTLSTGQLDILVAWQTK